MLNVEDLITITNLKIVLKKISKYYSNLNLDDNFNTNSIFLDLRKDHNLTTAEQMTMVYF